jgi:heat shock protein HslJ
MVNAQGTAFGERLKVNVRVLAAPTVTPAPTQTPSPNIQFNVDRDHIKAGESVVFSWKVTNVKEYYFYSQFERWQDHPKQGDTGSEQEYPQAPSTTYYLRVVLPDGSVQTPSITVYVEAVPAAPQITQFTVDPAGQVTLGQCVTIRWKVEGDKIDNVKLSANGEVLWAPAPTGGNTPHCPAALGPVTYLLEAAGPGGTTSAQQQIQIIPEDKPVPPPEDPVIYAFDVSPNQITVGNCVNVTYSAGGGTVSLRIMRDGGPYWDPPTLEGTFCDTLNEQRDYAYQLVARGQAKDVTSDVKRVSAATAPPQNPLANTRWQVTALGAPGLPGTNPVLPGTTLTMDFGPDGSLNGSSGCNTYSATYLVSGSQLSITPPIGPGMMCAEPAGVMEQEAAFLALLPAVGGFTIEGSSNLRLLDGSGVVVAELFAY